MDAQSIADRLVVLRNALPQNRFANNAAVDVFRRTAGALHKSLATRCVSGVHANGYRVPPPFETASDLLF